MDFKGLRDRAQVLGSSAAEITGAASETVSKLLDEFNAALPTMRALGFNVEFLSVEMGLLPKIRARLTATAKDLDIKALEDLIQKKGEQKTLVAVLKALQTAYNVRDQLGELGLKGVEIDIALGVPPSISIGFVKSEAVAAAAAAAKPAV